MTFICENESGENMEIIGILLYSTNGFSIFCSTMVLISYIILPKLFKNWLMRYLAYLNITNLFFGVISILYANILITRQSPGNLFFYIYFSIRFSSLIWPLIIAIKLYQIIKWNNTLSQYEPLFVIIGFLGPIIITCILWLFGLNNESLLVKVIVLLIQVFLMIFFTLLTYIKMIKAAKFALDNETAKGFIKLILPYVVVIITVSLSAFAADIMYISEECFSINSSILISIKYLQGFFDAIIFSLNPTVKEEVRKYFKKDNDKEIDLILF